MNEDMSRDNVKSEDQKADRRNNRIRSAFNN